LINASFVTALSVILPQIFSATDFAALVLIADGPLLSSAIASINLMIFLLPIVPERS